MTREEYVEDIKLDLGDPIVEIENEEVLGKLVDKAFREIRRYIVETHYITVPYSTQGIDMAPYHVNAVMQIFRTNNPNKVQGDVVSEIYAMSSLNSAYTSSTNLLMSNYVYRTQLHQLKSEMQTDLDFTFDKERQILHVATFYPKPNAITIVYTPDFEDVSDVKDDFWVTYIERLATAFAKISLGRIRSKYELSSSLYKLDGNTIVSEGITERDQIRQELVENHDLAFPID